MAPASTSLKNAAVLFHALSDETRLELLEHLSNGERCVCELTDAMKATQSLLSFHLRVLKDAGLILDRREGRWMYYSISSSAINALDEVLDGLKRASKSARAANRCC